MSSNNVTILDGYISEFKEENEIDLSKSELFEVFVATQITKQYELSYEEVSGSVVDGPSDGGIDSIVIIVQDYSVNSMDDIPSKELPGSSSVHLYICQSKTENSFKEGSIDKLLASMPVVFDLSVKEDDLLKRFNPRLVERIGIFRKIWLASSKGARINIHYIYACQADEVKVSLAYEGKRDQLIELTERSVSGAQVEFLSYSAREIILLCQRSQPTYLELKCKESPVYISYKGDRGRVGYVAVVNIKDYREFVTDSEGNIRESIFEDNIRHYQTGADVNKKIKETVESDFVNDFWWLNNGVTIIASDANQIGKNLNLKNVQIVNGLQTSYAIATSYREEFENDDRSVLVRVVVNTDKESIDKIISSNNSHSPVSPISLRATLKGQRDIEIFFQTKGYYYDRRKNFYRNQGRPASKIFSIQSVAQAIEAVIYREPASARSNPTTLVKEDKAYHRIFDESIDYGAYLNSCLIVQKSSTFMRRLPIDEKNGVYNFYYHMARVLAVVLIGKPDFSADDVKAIDVDSIGEESLRKAYDFLKKEIEIYQEENKSENIINISKSKKFSEALSKALMSKSLSS